MKGILIQGAKGIGKDFCYNILQDILFKKYNQKFKRYAFGDFLKELSFSKNHELNKSLLDGSSYDFDYLERDVKTILENDNLLKKFILDGGDIDKLLNYDEKYNLELIEIFKNIPELSTRKQLQTYSNHIKYEYNDLFFFSKNLKKEILREKKDFNYIINTDTRYISEIIDLMLEDFLPIKLIHEEYNKRSVNKLYNSHISELELGLNHNHIGYVIDLQGNHEINGFKRLNRDEIKGELEKFLKIYSNFKGYSKSFKTELLKIKKDLNNDIKYKKYEFNFSKKFGLESDSKEKDFDLYFNYINQNYLEKIKTLFKKEFRNIVNVKNISFK